MDAGAVLGSWQGERRRRGRKLLRLVCLCRQDELARGKCAHRELAGGVHGTKGRLDPAFRCQGLGVEYERALPLKGHTRPLPLQLPLPPWQLLSAELSSSLLQGRRSGAKSCPKHKGMQRSDIQSARVFINTCSSTRPNRRRERLKNGGACAYPPVHVVVEAQEDAGQGRARALSRAARYYADLRKRGAVGPKRQRVCHCAWAGPRRQEARREGRALR